VLIPVVVGGVWRLPTRAKAPAGSSVDA